METHASKSESQHYNSLNQGLSASLELIFSWFFFFIISLRTKWFPSVQILFFLLKNHQRQTVLVFIPFWPQTSDGVLNFWSLQWLSLTNPGVMDTPRVGTTESPQLTSSLFGPLAGGSAATHHIPSIGFSQIPTEKHWAEFYSSDLSALWAERTVFTQPGNNRDVIG